jgi:subtilase family serine protease
MNIRFVNSVPIGIGGLLVITAMAATALFAESPVPRIQSEVNNSEVSTLRGMPFVRAELDAGRMPANLRLNGVSILFNRSAAQQADLESLIAAQQNPRSPQYHRWLTPEQFAARFGMAQSDIDKVQTWLQQQGFSVDSVARGKGFVRFSGSVNQVEQAFRTEMHYYKGNGAQHFGPSIALSVPTAIAPTIQAVGNLSDFRPRPMHTSAHTRPDFTSSVSGSVFFAPGDIATVYDMNPLYSGGVNGAGQSIAVAGQSAVTTSDIENFQNAAGLAVKDPTMVLVPGTGSSQVFSGGDEGESDLDLEWSSAIAPGADIFFVYTGSNTNFNAFDSIQCAVDERIASIISVSYGSCETALNGFSLETVFTQAAAQGQTIVAASGDGGSTSCSGDTINGLTTTQQFALAVTYPASSPYVTGIGGTEITAANSVSTNSTYWQAKSSSDILSSAKIYIPEIAWNDSSSQNGLSASGGGPSALFSKPSWQKGVAGIPNDGKRDVPDVALYASPGLPGYLYCTSDTSSWNTSSVPVQQASCNNGFRDSSSSDLTVAGGTSFATPIFAGIVALINQKQGYTGGQGLLNPTIYTLASNSGTYASAFHDVTGGNNDCDAGSTFCGSTTTGFTAGTGYDQVTGLGSVDVDKLAGAWPASTTTLIGTKTAISATTTTPLVNTNDVFTITVTSESGSTTPTGTLTLDIDGGTTGGGTTVASAALTSGTYTYTTQFVTAGTHQIVAKYSGDTTHAASTGVITVTVGGTTSGTGSFTVSATNVTVSQGTSGNSTITLAPKNGYTGTVYLTFTTSNDSALANLCYAFTTSLSNGDGSVTLTGTSPVTTQMEFDTNASDCVTGGSIKGSGFNKSGVQPQMHRLGPAKTSQNTAPNPAPAAVALAGLLLAGFLGRHSRKLRALACVLALASVGFVLSACGGVTGSTVSNPPKGTYTITVTGTDSVTSANTAQGALTLVID